MMKILTFLFILTTSSLLVAEESDVHFEMVYEVFSLPIVKAAKLKRENLGGEKSYQRLLEGIEKGVVKQEKFVVMKLLDRQSASFEEIEEYVFPTEYEWEGFVLNQDGGLIDPIGLPFVASSIPLPIQFSAFDTKNTGDVIECEVHEANSGVEIRMDSTSVGFLQLDSFGKGVSEWRMPRFSLQRLKAGVEVKPGKPALIGTVSPPKDLQKMKGGKSVWLAFVTLKRIED